MFRVTVEEDFSAGHALRGYRGKCENLHGHNYKVQITVEGAQLDSIGLLCDFLHLKQIIRGIVQGLDHQFLNDLPAFSHVNPSAENLAKHFYEEASKQVAALPASARITGITVWETDVTSATYMPE
ncbi:MAG TPA: 6-carboxytetrahydropterin synthase QueD [Candidatus Acidoferrales bacterium]